MYERMLDKRTMPTIEELSRYCGENAELFSMLNEFMAKTYETEQKVVFPYGNKYGWGIGHYKKKKLICNVFAEAGAFTVMMRLSNTQYELIYDSLGKKAQEYINNKYPCGDGGWINYRVTCKEHLEDIQKLLVLKCS